MTPAPDAGPAKGVTTEADLRCPHPNTRHGSLFAAPALPGVVRWVLGNDMVHAETRVHEITVDADSVYVYEVDAWEMASLRWDEPGQSERQRSKYDAYWGSGMTLTRWLEQSEALDLDPSQWEVLVDPGQVLSVRNVSGKRLLSVTEPYLVPTISRTVRGWRRAA